MWLKFNKRARVKCWNNSELTYQPVFNPINFWREITPETKSWKLALPGNGRNKPQKQNKHPSSINTDVNSTYTPDHSAKQLQVRHSLQQNYCWIFPFPLLTKTSASYTVLFLSTGQVRSHSYFAERQNNDFPEKINTGKHSNYYFPENYTSEITV